MLIWIIRKSNWYIDENHEYIPIHLEEFERMNKKRALGRPFVCAIIRNIGCGCFNRELLSIIWIITPLFTKFNAKKS